MALDNDEVDTAFSAMDSWQSLAAQLKQDLASIILLSDAELQVNPQPPYQRGCHDCLKFCHGVASTVS